MLDQLVESKSGGRENRTRGGYLLTTFVLIVGLFFSAVLWSLFAKDLRMGSGSLDVSTLVAPIAESAPAPVQKEEKIEQTNQAKSVKATRQTNMLRIDENPIVPKSISLVPNTQKSRPNGNFQIAPDVLEGGGLPSGNTERETVGSGSGAGIRMNQPLPSENVAKIEPPPALRKPPIELTPKPKPKIQSLGVVNGKAKFLPKPVYSAAAKAIKATGDVNVQVTIDVQGNVVSANAASGHPLLRAEAERAARSAKFDPTFLSNQPVKVSGVIVYKFSLQ
jgi:TonB family protein